MRNVTDPDSTSGDLDFGYRNFLGLAIMLLLAINFTLNYLVYTYYPNNLPHLDNPGFWLFILNYTLIGGLVLLIKWVFRWSWKDLGLGRPRTWWQPLLVAAGVFICLVLFSEFIVPVIAEFSGPTKTDHLEPIRGNLSLLIYSILIGWITAAFLEEFVFRAFLIKSLEILLGKNSLATVSAVMISSLAFGLIHAYQGFSGILITGTIGLIFSIAYILNGRRIWPLILVHGLVDTIFLVNFYNS